MQHAPSNMSDERVRITAPARESVEYLNITNNETYTIRAFHALVPDTYLSIEI